MDERAWLVRAQEAEAFADAALSDSMREQWGRIADTCREMAKLAAEYRGVRAKLNP